MKIGEINSFPKKILFLIESTFIMKTCISLLLFLGCSFFLQAQVVSCPPNIDFENGTLSDWQFGIGVCCPINANAQGAPVNGRHTLMSGTGTDLYGGFPVVSPGGGNYSLKLGNASTGAQSEKARYYVHVPNNINNYSLLYKYAVVFQNPGHSASEQPRFEVKVYDSATGAPLPCAQFTYVATSNLPGFTLSNQGSQIWYKPWTTASIDLSGLAGQTIIVDFATGDCDLGGHFGYGYIDMSCGLFQVLSAICNSSPTITLSAPPGFLNYTWYDSSMSQVIGSGQNVTINSPSQNTVYQVVLNPYQGFGCPDTLQTLVAVSNVNIAVSNDTVICKNTPFQLYANASGSSTFFNYQWSGTGVSQLSCTQCDTTTLIPVNSSTYYVNATDQYGCNSADSVQVIVIGTDTMMTASICAGEQFMGYAQSGTFVDTFSTSSGCDSIRQIQLLVNQTSQSFHQHQICAGTDVFGYTTSGLFVDTFLNQYGCDSIRTLDLNVSNPSSTSINYTICQGDSYLGYSTAGIYIDTLSTSIGCDSVRILNLNVLPSYLVNLNFQKCIQDSVTILNQVYHQPGQYQIVVPTSLGCDSILQITVSDFPFVPLELGNDQRICPGYGFQLSAGDYQQYVWSNGDTGKVLQVNEPGLYTLWVTDFYGCKDTDQINLDFFPEPEVSIEATESEICKRQKIQLIGRGANQYTWYENTKNVPIGQSQQITFELNQQTSIILSGVDANLCNDDDTLQLFVLNCCDDVLLPNAFSPNSDGLNDEFKSITRLTYKEFNIKIFNRWGEVVFESTNPDIGWNGNHKGVACESGVYFYLLQIYCPQEDRKVLLKGDVFLTR